MGYLPYIPERRRQAIMRLTPELLMDVLQGRCRLMEPLPERCKLQAARMDHFANTVELLLEAPTYPQVSDGCVPPIMDGKMMMASVLPDLPAPPPTVSTNADPVFDYQEA